MKSAGLYDLLQQHCAGQPDRLAAVTGDQRMSYADLLERVDRVTGVLQARRVSPGDRVLWLGQNTHHVLELLVACARLGAMLCPVNWRQTTEELAFIVDDVAPRLIVSQRGSPSERLRPDSGASTAPDNAWLPIDGQGGYEELIASDTAPSLGALPTTPNPGTGLLMLYTAAFSGRPAAAVLTEDSLYLQGVVHMSVLETRHDEVNLVATPLFHVLAWSALMPVLIAGGTNIFVPRPDAEVICRAIAHDGATTGPIMPPTAMQVAELNADDRYDLSGFRSALRIRGWRDMTTPGPTVGGYGQTETAGPILLALPGAKLGGPIQGRPSPLARVRIVDEDHCDVPAGHTGEILVAGPTVTLGYWNRPEMNSARSQDGWWSTRDIGRRDPDGVITFIGPKLRMIKTGGENVYPAEVENCLEAHPGVASAALIGCPDKKWGQLVTAIVVLNPECNVGAGELISAVQDKLARYKAPKVVHFLPAMPTASGAKDYAALDARFGGGNYPGNG